MQRLITKRFAVAMLALCVVVGFAGQVQSAKKGTVTGVINVNNATREELMQLPGIGKVKADAIITYREQHRFEVPQDLTKVSGIGTALFNQLQPLVTTEGQTNLTSEFPSPATAAVK